MDAGVVPLQVYCKLNGSLVFCEEFGEAFLFARPLENIEIRNTFTDEGYYKYTIAVGTTVGYTRSTSTLY